jgi:hypothetical protein
MEKYMDWLNNEGWDERKQTDAWGDDEDEWE